MISTERDLAERLREDAKPGYGLDFTDTDKERADYWSAVAQRLRRDCTEAADALASIRAERDAAVAALKPLAGLGAFRQLPQDDAMVIAEFGNMYITAGDVRRAARAIAGEQKP